MQREAQRSVGQDATEIFQLPLPYEVYLKIFGYLTTKDLCSAMAVCKVGIHCVTCVGGYGLNSPFF